MEATKFMETRKQFAIVNGELKWGYEEGCQKMSTHDWLISKGYIKEEEFNDVIRGAVFSNRVMIFKGEDYRPVDMMEVSSAMMEKIVNRACSLNNTDKINVFNGAKVAEIGTDWDPICGLGEYYKTC